MLIRAIRAENFMKFASLRLAGLPERGIIGVEGANESGKTTIGEAVLFAFFGKTRASLETSVSRLIRWGADYLSVEVEFNVPGRGDFLIYREIDKYGTNFVKVIDSQTRAEVAAGNVNVSEFLSRTLKFDFFEFHQSFYHDQLQATLPKDAHSSFVERMTGIAQINDSLQGLKKDIEQLEREFAHYQKDVQRNLQQIEKYDRNAVKLPELRELARARAEELERARAEHRRRQEEVEAYKRLGDERQAVARKLENLTEESSAAILAAVSQVRAGLLALSGGSQVEREFAERNRDELKPHLGRLEELEGMLRDFQGLAGSASTLAIALQEELDPQAEKSLVAEELRLEEELIRVRRKSRRNGLGAAVLFLLAALAGALAGGLAAGISLPLPGSLAPRTGAAWRANPVFWGAAGVSALALLASLYLFSRWLGALGAARGLRSRLAAQAADIREAGEERRRIGGLLAIGPPGEVVRFVEASQSVADSGLAAARDDFVKAHGPLVEPEAEGEYRKALLSLARAERELRGRALREAQKGEKTLLDADGLVKKARSDLDKVESEIRECEAQAQKKELLLTKNRELQGRSQEIKAAIDLRRMSIELLDDTASSIRNKIGPALSRFMKEILPRLTQGRYRDIKVGSDLAVQVFTSDKSDFLDAAELSGGTHEALALALRLATSQAFIAARTRQSQFVFLDEPFKMMDEARALHAMEVLTQLSQEIQQVFLIQPNFTPDQRSRCALLLETSVATVDLAVPAHSHPGTDGIRGHAVDGSSAPAAGRREPTPLPESPARSEATAPDSFPS